MSSRAVPITLVDGDTREDVPATLLYDLSYDELRHTEDFWKPYLDCAEFELSMRGVSLDEMPDSRNWRWPEKMLHGQTVADSHYQDWVFYGVECVGYLQGAIAISTVPQPCEATVHKGQQAIGIELLASAPWNLKPFMTLLKRKPFLAAIGQTLIVIALSYSKAINCQGRIYLYSVPKAEAYYRDVCGMIDLGTRNHQGEVLRLFEMTKERAEALLEEWS